MVSEKLISLMDEFIEACKARGFHKQTAGVLGIMAGSKEAHAVFGDSIESFTKLVELTKSCNDEQDLINQFSRLVRPNHN